MQKIKTQQLGRNRFPLLKTHQYAIARSHQFGTFIYMAIVVFFDSCVNYFLIFRIAFVNIKQFSQTFLYAKIVCA